MKFEFDRRKSVINKQKHGLSLDEAAQLWQERCLEIKAKTAHEARGIVIGTLGGKRYACIYTMRGDVIRLISCRRAHPKEERFYDDYVKEKSQTPT